jgi:hypothetical protein
MYGSQQFDYNRILSSTFLIRAFILIVSRCSLPVFAMGRGRLLLPSAGQWSSIVIFPLFSKYNILTTYFPAELATGLSTSRLPSSVFYTPSSGVGIFSASCSERGASLFDFEVLLSEIQSELLMLNTTALTNWPWSKCGSWVSRSASNSSYSPLLQKKVESSLKAVGGTIPAALGFWCVLPWPIVLRNLYAGEHSLFIMPHHLGK